MFKKLLGLMLAITLLASTTAQAEILPEPVLGSSDGVITSVTASALTINPDEAQTTTISFTLSAPAAVSAYILYPNYGDAGFTDVNDTRIYFLGSDTTTVSLTPTTTSPYIWTGKVGNLPTGTSLVNGTYKVRVVATSGTPAVKNFAGVNVTIDDTYTNGIPSIRNLKADPSTFAADGNSDTEFTFNVTESANITAAVKKISAGGYEVVKSFSDYNGNWHTYSSSHSITWDGRDNAGNYVANGTYYFIVDASNTPGTNTGSDNEKIMLTITSDTVVSGTLENVKLDPSKNWDPTDGDLEIAYDLTKDARSVTVTAKKQGTNKLIEILSDDYVDADDYTETWDGTDEDGDYVESGSYDVVIRADNVAITKVVNVEYSKPTINEVFVTKTSFDTSKEEVVSLAFKVEAEAEMTVDLYNGSKKEFTLVKDEKVRKNRWYYVEWDGLDNEGDEAIAGNAWKFKISAKNSTDDEIFDSKFVEIDVADDDVSTGKANVTNDAVAPVVFDSDTEESLDLSYCIDDTAEVYIAVYEGLSTSGNAEVELLDYEEQDSGCHTVTWDGTDEDGKILSDGTYSYKIISKIGSKKDTETGRFVFGTKGGARVVPNPEPTPEPNPETSTCEDLYRDLGTMKDSEMCNAIVWASENGVFQGYNDGTFKPYAPINRAETLKVVLESNGATILPSAGSNLGFTDVDANAWYMPYIRTAKFYGIFSGHSDGRAAANDVVTRVEFLKIALESYKALNGLNLEGYFSDYADVDYTQWYAKYLGAAYEYNLFNTNEFGGRTYLDPTRALNRGEAALLLYKLEQQNQARI